LQECIDAALQNNETINNSRFQSEQATINRQQAKYNLLPVANMGIDHNLYNGKSIDPSTNSFVSQQFISANYGANANITLFQGFALRNQLREATWTEAAATMDYQYQKDLVTLNVMLLYLQILNNEDVLVQAQAQAELTAAQVKRLWVLDSLGAIAPATLYDMQGQYAGDKMNIANARQNLIGSKIALCRLLNRSYDSSFAVERFQEEINFPAVKPEWTIQEAWKHFSAVQAAQFKTKAARAAWQAAKGNRYPALSFGSNISSNYSNSNALVSAYTKQLSNNFSSGFGLSLNVPLFQAFRNQSNIRLAKIRMKAASFAERTTRNNVQADIQQAYVNVTVSLEKYEEQQKQTEAYNRSYLAAEARFAAGVGNITDYLMVKNNLDRSKLNLIGSKYEYILRIKIYEFYQNTSR
jgi:outer membrane protein